jgi:lysophospholipase L1-like esterase
MGTFGDKFGEAWRNYNTDGVPASGDYEPEKALIRAIGPALDVAINSAAAGLPSYATVADLPTSPTPADGAQARVYADPTGTNNVVWKYTSGAWAIDHDFYSALANVVQPLVDEAAASAAASAASAAASAAQVATVKAAVSRTQISRLGTPGTLVTGASATANVTWIGDDAAAQTGTVNTIRFWAATGGTIKIKRYTLSGSTYTYVATSVASLTVVAGLNTFVSGTDFTAFAINAGDHIGIYSSAAVSTSIGTAGTGWLATNAAGDNTSTVTRSNVAGAYFQVNLDISYPALMNVASEIDAEAAARAAADATLTNALNKTLYSTTGSNPPIAGSASAVANNTWIGDDGALIAGTAQTIKFWASGSGTVKVKKYSLSGSVFTYLGTYATLNVVAGLNTFTAGVDFTAFPVSVGDHFAYYSTSAVVMYSTTAGTGWLASNASGDNTTTASRSTTAGAYFQMGVTVSYTQLYNMATELAARVTPFDPPADNASYYLFHENDVNGWQQVFTARKSDGTTFQLTTGNQHSVGNLLASDATIVGISQKQADGSELSYYVPIEGPAASALILHSRKDQQCWGDSLTAGATISNPSVNGWVAKLAVLTGRQALNGGVNGETSTQIKTRMLAASQSIHERTAFLWSGTNNSTQISTVLADTASMVAAMVGKSKRFIVLPCFNTDTEGTGTTSYNQKMALNAALASAYPGNYYDIRSYLASLQALADAGLTADSTDLANIAADIIPHQLRGDNLHPNATAATLIANKFYAQLQARGWL